MTNALQVSKVRSIVALDYTTGRIVEAVEPCRPLVRTARYPCPPTANRQPLPNTGCFKGFPPHDSGMFGSKMSGR